MNSCLSRLLMGITCLGIATLTFAAASTPIDYSYAGYAGGGTTLPAVPARVSVKPSGADDTELIQSAIASLEAMPVQADGFRGAVLLRSGTYHVEGQIKLAKEGVVLRGEGATLLATGSSRRSLILVGTPVPPQAKEAGISLAADAPAGTLQLQLTGTDGLRVGQRVCIRRPSTKSWIALLGADQFTGNFKDIRLNWSEGSRDLEWVRAVLAIDATSRTLTLDAPITTSLERQHGGASVSALREPEPLSQVGIENLILESAYDPSRPADEEHAWIAIQVEATRDAWVRNVTTRCFVSASIWLGTGTQRITVQDCRSEAPVGEDAGWRRFGFYAGGQELLVLRCSADQARQPFLAGLCAAGPIVFEDCKATRASGSSGSIESWASGVLFDRIQSDQALVLGNLGEAWQGAGWNAANSVLWNCTAPAMTAENPPGATNLNVSDATLPSLYRAQLQKRLGSSALTALEPVEMKASEMGAVPLLKTAPSSPLATHEGAAAKGASKLDDEWSRSARPASEPRSVAIEGGRFTSAGRALLGGASSNAWWKGQTVPARAAELGWSATRWAPGRIGPGLTEDLDQLAERLRMEGVTLAHVWPGLWYDRRRDDHLTVSRETSNAWAPFYEMPWARSGEGTAADGLSKYDLSKYNPWYWQRLREFATACAGHDMVMYHHFYNHHNLIEAAAHWAEFPWRTANCIQATGFPEPPPWENNGTRIALVASFYDVTHPVRRALHRAYIFHGLDALADQPNVIHTLAFQFAGPLSFQQFFLDTVAEWEKARGRKALVVLNTSKQITDAILADPVRARVVSAVDQRYWQYLSDGTLFAPHTDGKMAFRENRVATFGKDAVPVTSPELVYKQVREYHDRFPELAIICGHAGQGPLPILMASGALPLLADYAASQPLKKERDDLALFTFLRTRLSRSLPRMQPSEMAKNTWSLSGDGRHLLYSLSGAMIELQKTGPDLLGVWFDPRSGRTVEAASTKGSREWKKPDTGPWLLLLEPATANAP